MRFQELRDADGTVLARGLHPAIAVVAASATARATVTSAVANSKGCRVIHAKDVDDRLSRATAEAVERHETAVVEKKDRVAEAEKALDDASAVSLNASRQTSVANGDLASFDELAGRLAAAEEEYEAAVRDDAEAARSLAAALGELDRILGQRHSASTSLEQARKARDNRGVPEAVITQAMNLQAALAKAEAEKHDLVRQADESSQAARKASRNALLALESAHDALRHGMAQIAGGAPDWGAGVPLPGLVANYRDHLAAAVSAAETAEAEAKALERTARARLEQERHDLEVLVGTGAAVLDPLKTADQWLASDDFSSDDAVVADDAFARFGPEGVASLLTTVSGRGCQVIYLTEEPEVLGWAIGLPHEAGGATTISSGRDRKPVLVHD